MKIVKLITLYVSASLLLWSCGSVNSPPPIVRMNDAVKKQPTVAVEKAEKSLVTPGQAVGSQPSRGMPKNRNQNITEPVLKQADKAVEQLRPQVPAKVETLTQNQVLPEVHDTPQVQESQVQEPVNEAPENKKNDVQTLKNQEPLANDKSSEQDTTVKLSGSKDFINKVQEALNLLKEKDLEAYKKVNKYLSKIVENENSGVDVYSKTFFLGKGTVSAGDAFWLAGVIVHDAYHSELFYSNKPFTGAEAENACNQQQKTALRNIGAPEHYLSYLDEVSESQYWEVPFEQRGW